MSIKKRKSGIVTSLVYADSTPGNLKKTTTTRHIYFKRNYKNTGLLLTNTSEVLRSEHSWSSLSNARLLFRIYTQITALLHNFKARHPRLFKTAVPWGKSTRAVCLMVEWGQLGRWRKRKEEERRRHGVAWRMTLSSRRLEIPLHTKTSGMHAHTN